MIMKSALCDKLHHDEHAHTQKAVRQLGNEALSVQKTVQNQVVGEPIKQSVNDLTQPAEQSESQTANQANTVAASEATLHNDAVLEELNATTATAISSDAVISDDLLIDDRVSDERLVDGLTEANEKALNQALQTVIAEEGIDEALLETIKVHDDTLSDEWLMNDLLADIEPTPYRTPLSRFIGLLNGEKFSANNDEEDDIEYIYGDNVYDDIAEATVETYNETEDTNYQECIGDDSKVETDEDWLNHLKSKIKELMLNDEDNECLDILLNEFYIAS